MISDRGRQFLKFLPLPAVQSGIDSLLGKQFLVGADFCNPPVRQYHNPIGAHYGGKAVRDGNDGFLAGKSFDGFLNLRLRFIVYCAGCLVKNQNRSISQNGTGNIAILCFCPPDSRTPRSPIAV